MKWRSRFAAIAVAILILLSGVHVPALTTDGGLSEESQRKALELILQVQGIKEMPPLERFFDFAIQKRLSTEFKNKNWKP